MSFSETIFLFFLALIIFGPKKLPEMARQAGRLLAELRRASNEFKSQIETEIAHLEVEKSQTVLPPSPPPQGAVASEPFQHQLESPAATAALTAETASVDSNPPTPQNSTPSTEAAAEPTPAAAQESHV